MPIDESVGQWDPRKEQEDRHIRSKTQLGASAAGLSRAFDPFNSFEDMKDVFTYHAPDQIQVQYYANIRAAALVFAEQLMQLPACADRTAALRHLREAVMTANAAIALRARI